MANCLEMSKISFTFGVYPSSEAGDSHPDFGTCKGHNTVVQIWLPLLAAVSDYGCKPNSLTYFSVLFVG